MRCLKPMQRPWPRLARGSSACPAAHGCSFSPLSRCPRPPSHPSLGRRALCANTWVCLCPWRWGPLGNVVGERVRTEERQELTSPSGESGGPPHTAWGLTSGCVAGGPRAGVPAGDWLWRFRVSVCSHVKWEQCQSPCLVTGKFLLDHRKWWFPKLNAIQYSNFTESHVDIFTVYNNL